MNNIKHQINLLLLSIQFYTRLPVKPFSYDEAYINQTSRFVAVVGFIVGFIIAVVFFILSECLNPLTASVLAIFFGVLLTGAFHEDGLADSADGLGGAFEAERVLEIMKDSRMGAYGTCAMVFTLLARISLLAELTVAQAMLVLPLLHALSRTIAVSLMIDTNYAQLDALSKVKPIAKSIDSTDKNAVLLSLLICFAGFSCLSVSATIAMMISLLMLRQLSRRFFIRKINGYTGDCLGAVEQLAEITIFICVVAFLVI